MKYKIFARNKFLYKQYSNIKMILWPRLTNRKQKISINILNIIDLFNLFLVSETITIINTIYTYIISDKVKDYIQTNHTGAYLRVYHKTITYYRKRQFREHVETFPGTACRRSRQCYGERQGVYMADDE